MGLGSEFAWLRPLTPALSPEGRGGVYGVMTGGRLVAVARRRLRKGNPGVPATTRTANSVFVRAPDQKVQGWPGGAKATLGTLAKTRTANSLSPLAGRGLG